MRQNSPELLAQALLHFVLGGKNAIFGQPTRFDIAVEQHHVRPSLGQFLGSIQSSWTSADNANQVPAICLCVRHTSSLLGLYRAAIMPAISGLPSLRVYGEQHLADITPFLEKTVCCGGCGERKRVRNDRVNLSLPIEL